MQLITNDLLESLNPCCSGIWSQTYVFHDLILNGCCLNPCCNGIWSQTLKSFFPCGSAGSVLILVVMEYGLRHGQKPFTSCFLVLILVVMEYGLRLTTWRTGWPSKVLILVVMEYGLRLWFQRFKDRVCLNPCCNGIWSQTLVMMTSPVF